MLGGTPVHTQYQDFLYEFFIYRNTGENAAYTMFGSPLIFCCAVFKCRWNLASRKEQIRFELSEF